MRATRSSARRQHRGTTVSALPLLLLPLPLVACPVEDGAGTSATEGTTGASGNASLPPDDDPTTSTTEPWPTTTGTTSPGSTTTGATTDATTSSTTNTDTSTAGTTDDTTTLDTTTSSDATSTGAETTGSACGNGSTDDDEECDPSDPKLVEVAVCNDACKWKGVVVFVTDAEFLGDLGGVEGADQKCRDAAAQAGLQSPEKYIAWLSVGDNTAASRVPLVDKPYYVLSGDAIALDQGALLSGKLLHAIDVTENKDVLGIRRVWTNTTPAGETASKSADCQSFTSPSDADSAAFGFTKDTGTSWTEAMQTYCDKPLRLYCFSGEF